MNKHIKIHESFTIDEKINNIHNRREDYLYHGTNRDFDNIDSIKNRAERTEKFHGGGFFLTPSINVARKYARSNYNSFLPYDIITKAKSVDKNLYSFMYDLYHRGNSVWRSKKHKEILSTDYKDTEITPNEICDLVNLIPGSKSLQDYDKNSQEETQFFDIFSTSTETIHQIDINNLKKLGLGDYNYKVYIVKLKPKITSKIIELNKKDEIKKSNADIIIASGIDDLVDNVPEIIIKDTSLVNIIKKVNI